jgi:hypothetical protein
MADNTHYYGFRWARSNNKPCPSPEWHTVATGYDGQDDGSNSVDMNIGDPVKIVAGGGVELGVAADASLYGVIVAVDYHWNGTVMTQTGKLPNQNSWGTIEARRPRVGVVPFKAGYWEIDCDDATTATTYAAYVALRGSNCNLVCPGNTTDTTLDPYLDISTTATTESLHFRVVAISTTAANQDFSGNYVKLIVEINDSQEASSPATATVGV